MKTEEDEPDPNARNEFNEEQQRKISEQMDNFTKPGNPGVKFKKIYDKMLATLELPKHVKEDLGIDQVQPNAEAEPNQEEVKEGEAPEEDVKEQIPNNDNTTDYKKYLQTGRVFLIPSFFSLVRALKKAKREYAIVFRGFGPDVKIAVDEFNAYSLT